MKHSIEYIGRQLREARQKKGLSQRALGIKLGIPQGHISKIENGLIDLQASSLIQFCRFLDLELMLIPRKLMSTIEALRDPQRDYSESVPAYRLRVEDEES